MTSWYSSLLTRTTSQFSSLRSTLLPSEADGETEDDTHVCRVLRAYYADNGRPLPPWLPPDPKAPSPVPQPMLAAPTTARAYRGGPAHGAGAAGSSGPGPGGGGGGLSSLWDNNNSESQHQASHAPHSLRAAAGRGAGRQPTDSQLARPPPSQRSGSYQSSGSGQLGSAGAGPPSTAQDRLRQRLWGSARTASPPHGQQGSFHPPASMASSAHSGSSRGGGGSSGAGNYEDRFAPEGTYDGKRQGLPPRSRGYGRAEPQS